MPDLRIGGLLDPDSHERTDATTVIETADLTTHGVIVGMTGSGKTGMGVVLVEECLAAGIPALVIDPKGDLTNLCLTFPALAPADFTPWVNAGDVAAAGVSAADFAAGQATLWRDGLAEWGLGSEQLTALRAAVEFEVYTPGSAAGRPLNIVGSLQAPVPGTDPEDIADEIEGYVSSLLSMLGVAADPLASREHVLLSSIIAASWGAGRDLDLASLVVQVQQPPMRKLGVLELDQFFPPADRGSFAVRLNSLLASPGFATWLSGDPIDIDAMLRAPDRRPRCAIVTTAHLSDEQRMSVTALVLSKFVTWTRRQGGASDLRALLYMDEVAGYLPPTANPPTKKPMLTLLKQARAFGVGVVLSTQNPVDLDYKALSNAGTWLIGRLQTERDKARLVDGLTSATGDVDVSALGDTISGLGKRQFVLKAVGSTSPVLTSSRWAMSYLRGPLMRDEIGRLAELGLVVRARSAQPAEPIDNQALGGVAPGGVARDDTTSVASPTDSDETPVPPAVAPGVPVSHVDPAAPWAAALGALPGTHVRAAVVARVHLRYDEVKADLVHDEEYEAVLFPIPALPSGSDFVPVDYDDRDLSDSATGPLSYGIAAGDLDSKSWWSSLQRSLTDHLVRSRSVEVVVNRELKVYSRVGESREEFGARCAAAADAKADAAIAALRAKYESKLRALNARYDSAASARSRAETRHEAEHGAGAQVATLLGGLLGGRRSRGSVLSEARRASASQARVQAAADKASAVSRAILDLEDELAAEVAAIDARWTGSAQGIETLAVPLEKSDVAVTDLRLAWLPVG